MCFTPIIWTMKRSNKVVAFEAFHPGLESGRLFKGTFHANGDNIWEGRVVIHVMHITLLLSRRLRRRTAC